jgi:hypothetical protein
LGVKYEKNQNWKNSEEKRLAKRQSGNPAEDRVIPLRFSHQLS